MQKEQLSFLEILAICMGTILTTAVFLLPAEIAKDLGYGSIYVWIVVAIITAMIGFSFAELSSMFAKSGGPFNFVREAFGDFWGFVAGWSTWLYSTIAISMLAIVTSLYISAVWPSSAFQEQLLALAILAAFTAVNWFGVKFGAKIEMIMIALGVLVLAAYAFLGLPSADLSRFALPAIELSAFGIAALLALEPFIGWETSTIIAEEVRHPKKHIPKALAYATTILTILYLAVIVAFLGNASQENLALKNPVASAAQNFAGAFAPIFPYAAILIGLTAMNSWMLTTARMPFVMAREKFFLRSFEKTNKYGVPREALILQFLFAGSLVFLGTLGLILETLLTVAVVLYILTLAALIDLRGKIEHHFRVPLAFPVIGIFSLLALVSFVNLNILVLGTLLMLSGIPAYIVVKLLYDRTFVEKFWDRFSSAMNIYTSVIYGSAGLDRVLQNAKLKRGQKVLDYGAGTGMSTEKIAAAIHPGTVVAADISKKQLNKAVERAKQKKIENVIFVKLSRPAPFEKNTFDRIVCKVALNYFTNPQKELGALARSLKRNGIASFLAVKAPGIIMHPFLAHDSNIKTTFERAGFKRPSIQRTGKHIYIVARKL